MINSNNLYLITNANSSSYRVKESSLGAKEWFLKYNVNHIEKRVEDLTYDDIEYIVEVVSLFLPNGKVEKISDIINKHSKLNHNKIRNILSKHNINYDNIKDCQIVRAISLCPELLRTPIALKDEIAIVGCETEEYTQFLEGDIREDTFWLGADKSFTSEQKVEWIIKNLGMPKVAYSSNTQLYFPETSVLYGGKMGI